jgi:spore cortex formation protein SpoVR/YcgB (stage V sporulation)
MVALNVRNHNNFVHNNYIFNRLKDTQYNVYSLINSAKEL